MVFKASELGPGYESIQFNTIDDLIYLGGEAITHLVESWKYELQNLAYEYSEIVNKMKLLRGKKPSSFKKLARKFENPQRMKIKVISEGISRGFKEPVDEKSRVRAQGSTTFNICGWCKYAGCGSACYNYHIQTQCSFKTTGGLDDKQRSFNTPCLFHSIAQKELDEIREALTGQCKIVKTSITTIRSKIKFLTGLKSKAVQKPAICSVRPHNWFNLGDKVFVFNNSQGLFIKGTVSKGYRHQDGWVTVKLEEEISVRRKKLKPMGMGEERPEVLHEWEYQFFSKNPSFINTWLENTEVAKYEGFKQENFKCALIKAGKLKQLEPVVVTEKSVNADFELV